MGTSINHTVALNLKNKGPQNVNRGDSVIVDTINNAAFWVTGSAQMTGRVTIGIVLDTGGIVTGTTGLVAIGGYVPLVNLVTGGNIGDTFGLSAVIGKAQSHSVPLPGDFGQTLGAGATPDAILYNNYNPFISDTYFYQYTGANINLGTSISASWTDVDATNAAVTFTPSAPGKYEVTFQFADYVNPSAAGGAVTYFSLLEGSTRTPALVNYFNEDSSSANATSITLSYIFNWTNTNTKTIKLQKWIDGSISVSQHLILADGYAGRTLFVSIKRVGS